MTWEHDDDGSLLLRARLPPEEGKIVLAAIEAGTERLREERRRPDEGASAEAAAQPVSTEAGATPESEDASAEAPTVSEQRADALVLMADTMLSHAPNPRGGDRYQVVLHVDADSLSGRADGGRSELEDGAPLAVETARRLACDAAIVPLIERDGRPLSVGRKTRSVPPALRRALASRDRGCRFPGCTNGCTVDAHHIRHWAHGGPTSLDNLVQLCRHHHRLLHEGGYTVEIAGRDFVFRRPDGRRIRAVPRPPAGRVRSLREGNARSRRPIDPDACVPKSGGERMDLGLCVDAMLAFAPSEAPGI